MNEALRKRYETRLEGLIETGKSLTQYERVHDFSALRYLAEESRPKIAAWQVQIKNIISLIFGSESVQYNYVIENLPKSITNNNNIRDYIGVLEGCLNDLKDGFIAGVEFIISSEFFDSVLQEAKYLNEHGFKDPSAVLTRVVIESTLQKLAEKNEINHDQKASNLNEALRSEGIYPKPQWRLVQANLDIGNEAAHGNFDSYTQEDVKSMINFSELFNATYLGS